jgi:hypothetical protein
MGQEMRWVPRDELGQLGFPPADAELIEMLRKSVGASLPRRPAPPALER